MPGSMCSSKTCALFRCNFWRCITADRCTPAVHLAVGDQSLYEAAAGPLDVMGKAKFFLGDVGAGAHMKLVVNMVMGSMMAAFAEGLVLADQVGDKGRRGIAALERQGGG